MQENFSDAETILARKKDQKFQNRVKILRGLLIILLVFGSFITVFSYSMWNSTYNELLRALSLTGIVTILACIIGLYGCHRCL